MKQGGKIGKKDHLFVEPRLIHHLRLLMRQNMREIKRKEEVKMSLEPSCCTFDHHREPLMTLETDNKKGEKQDVSDGARSIS
jgi:hypothetical protein